MTELIDIISETERLGREVEAGLRAEGASYLKQAIDEFVRDGSAACTLRLSEIPLAEWREIDADIHRHAHGLPMKREWLTGSEPMLLIEYVADPDSGDVQDDEVAA